MVLDKSRLTIIYDNWVNIFQDAEENITCEFTACSTDVAKADFVYQLFKKYPLDVYTDRVGKDNTTSKTVRETGNANYVKKYWDTAAECYSKGIAYAEKDSEDLAMALGNRAASLLNLGFIAEALVDVTRALNVSTINESYREKLNSRKDMCLKRIIETKEMPSRINVQELKTQNKYLTCCADKVALKENETLGRYIVATDEIKTGEILMVEKPYSSVLLANGYYTHCRRCFLRSPVLIECENCTSAMYCSTECLQSHKNVHIIECPLLEYLVKLEAGPIDFLAVRILIDALLGDTPIHTLTGEEPEDDTYRSSDLRRVYNLVGNGHQRSIADMFRRCFSAAVLVDGLKKFTPFFDQFDISESETRGFILHFLQSLPCNAHEVTVAFRPIKYAKNEERKTKVQEIGAAVYATLSLINHSCEPNVVRHSIGDKCVVRAIRLIRPGDEIVDNYGYHYATDDIEERQKSLMRQYYFQCACEACVNNWPMYNNIPLDDPECPNQQEFERYRELTKKFGVCLLTALDEESSEEELNFLCSFLDFLDKDLKVEKPWQVYNNCQEAIKHALNWFPGFNRS